MTDADAVKYEQLAQSEDAAEKKKDDDHVPRAAFFIMGNEGCERFSYYGMKAILAIFLHKYLLFDQHQATTTVHVFVGLCYCMPICGAILADSYWGRYKTIINLSLVYSVGNLIMSICAIPGVAGNPPTPWGTIVALLFIAFGTGGIKPCVSSFVGDQFKPGQEHLLSSIFAAFYFVINIGSLASTIVTPLLREYVSYAAAFGLPAGLLLLSTLIFWMGRSAYRYIPPGGDNIVVIFMKVIGFAVAEKRRCHKAGVRPLPHWLDYALVSYPKATVDDVRRVLSVMTVFLPLPMFWALFDQYASRWIFQANDMDLHLGPDFRLLPDQIPMLNPMLLLIFIPIFDRLLYPLLRRAGLSLMPLHRMATGMVLATISFAMAGGLQIVIDQVGVGKVHVAWQIPQYVVMCWAEIMVSVTGLEFAYSQAPRSMKSVVMSAFLLTTSVGNMFIAIIAAVRFHHRMIEFFFFSGAMLLFMFLFIYITRGYRYRRLRATQVDEPPRGEPNAHDESDDSETETTALADIKV